MIADRQTAVDVGSAVPLEVRKALADALAKDARERALREDPVYRSLWEGTKSRV